MNTTESTSNVAPANTVVENTVPKPFARYQRVYNGRKQAIRGLWKRNGRFYARLSVEDPNTGRKKTLRIPLKVQTVAQAEAELRRLKTKRDDNTLPVLKLTPKFCDYVKIYFDFYEKVKDAKRPKTLQTEKGHLTRWIEHLGETRLDKISKPMINDFIAKRQGETVCGRTVNLAVGALRNVLNRAIDDGYIQRLPTENLRPLKWTPKRKELVSLPQINSLCAAGLEVSKNGLQFSDYIKLMAFCGSRASETLRLAWQDVNWQQKQLTIGSDGLAKNHQSRVVDFNPALELHLKEMFSRRAPDSDFLFPSPQRGEKNIRAKTFRETLLLAREKAKMPFFGFHHCRHFFISYAVMSGINFMTIARFVGHADGGILIGKVYGHLSNEFAKLQAQQLNFQPVVVKDLASTAI
jgi:integrase